MPQKAAQTPSSSSSNSSSYTRNSPRGGVFECELLEKRPGFARLEVSGKGAVAAFRHEAGGHRWQRVPPTEKRGRVHTSTITVATLPVPETTTVVLRERDIEWTCFRGSGAGGQHRNVTDSAVRVIHKPSGLVVKCESERARHVNLATAKRILIARLDALQRSKKRSRQNALRKNQVGSGMRGDKRRTVRVQADRVIDHVTGRSTTAKRYLRGDLDALVK